MIFFLISQAHKKKFLPTEEIFYVEMKKQLSSLDLHFVLKELKILEGSRIDSVHQRENTILFQFYKTNMGKKMLHILVGESMFLAEEKEDYPGPGNFSMALRKHLSSAKLESLRQINSERIVELAFSSKIGGKKIYLEFFGKGNAVLCDEQGIIINALQRHEFKDRSVKPKMKYIHPEMRYNFLSVSPDILAELLRNSKIDSVVKCLAIELGFGGAYSEEICLASGIDKNTPPKLIEGKQIKKIHSSISGLINSKIDARIIFKNGEITAVCPFGMEIYRNYEAKNFDSFSAALEFFYSFFRPKIKSEYEKRIGKLRSRLQEQSSAIESLRNEEQELREKGELIYRRYSLVKEILEEISKASAKLSWKEIKEKLKGHKIIKEVNEKERKVIVEA